jgi:hypothetical protein
LAILNKQLLIMDTPASIEKLGQEQDVVYASSSTGEVEESKANQWEYLKHYFTSREGWIGDYVRVLGLLLFFKTPKLTQTFRTTSTLLHPTSGP